MLTKVEFVLYYLKYLSTWNKSASLLSIIGTLQEELIQVKKSAPIDGYSPNMQFIFDFEELLRVSSFEYNDTQIMTDQKIYSMEEVLDFLKVEKRNRDIDCILN